MTVNLRNVDLNLLTVFDAVLRAGSLSSAARTLGMSQPAASNALARLRDTFDDPLFIRGRQGMTPTARATELGGPVREALAILQEALDTSPSFDPARSDRTFHLAMGDYGELVLLPALLRHLGEIGDRMRIHTYPDGDADTQGRLRRGAIDFAFGYAMPSDTQLDGCAIGEEEVVVIARAGHPAIGKRLTRKAYLAARHVVLAEPDARRTVLESLWPEHDSIPRNVAARVQQYAAMPGLVATSDCLATLPRRLAEQAVQGAALELHRLPFASGRVEACMVWHRSRERDAGHAWLKQTILDLIARARRRSRGSVRRG